jgi:hypothetical protein
MSLKQKERISFNIHSQRFELEKTCEVKLHHEVHSISLCLNNVKVFYKEWNIEL